MGLFLVPEESAPPRELRDVEELVATAAARTARLPHAERDGFVRAAVDPYVNALRRALAGMRRSVRPSIRAARRALVERALAGGPEALTRHERRVVLHDPETADALHTGVWQLADREGAARWGRPGSAGGHRAPP